MPIIQLKPGREKPVQRGHPWIFSGSIAKISGVEGIGMPGETVRVVDSSGHFLAWGAISPRSQIRVRIWSWKEEDEVGADFFYQQISEAVGLRRMLIQPGEVDAYRLLHAESDGLPGLIVDKYGGTLVVQFLTCGVEFWRDILVEQLEKITGCNQIYERSDADIRQLEGLEPRIGILIGPDINRPVKIREAGVEYWVDIARGQKTGFYLDQRENRSVVRGLASGRTILDCFAYSGGFSISGLAGGAVSVTAVDSSAEALQLARENLKLNHFNEGSVEWLEADVFNLLRKLRDQNQKFDLVVLDPPKFAPTAAHVQKASRGYKDINLLAFKLLKPGGVMVTFSCSGGVGEELFQKIVAGAAVDAGVQAKIIKRLGPSADHPVALNFPEGAYLKGLVVVIK
jgi:23S rRNA (cytosine1962-C5)-methyltransferase